MKLARLFGPYHATMKFPLSCIAAAVALVAMAVGAAKTDPAASPPIENQVFPISDEWVRDLADERFQTREEAMRRLWDLGKPALPLLEEAAHSPDPERAIRAASIRDWILMGVTPNTDPEILSWIEQFPGAPVQRKLALNLSDVSMQPGVEMGCILGCDILNGDVTNLAPAVVHCGNHIDWKPSKHAGVTLTTPFT